MAPTFFSNGHTVALSKEWRVLAKNCLIFICRDTKKVTTAPTYSCPLQYAALEGT